MDIFDLFRAKPGMRFVIRRVIPNSVHKVDAFLQSINGIQIKYSPGGSASGGGNAPHFIKILDDFDPIDFIRNTHDKIAVIFCRIPRGAYYEISSSLVVQHRYASTEADDTNQGFAHALEIIEPDTGKTIFCLHGFDARTGHEVYETATLEQSLRLYDSMLHYGFSAVKNRLEIKKQYTVPKSDKPWFLR
ncbi:hypothetical protein GF391_01625 [Candidatus Uhrbacteria bacterium]|nr:hypothetical protein [Candidatus Uhrbacteria bacterium]